MSAKSVDMENKELENALTIVHPSAWAKQIQLKIECEFGKVAFETVPYDMTMASRNGASSLK